MSLKDIIEVDFTILNNETNNKKNSENWKKRNFENRDIQHHLLTKGKEVPPIPVQDSDKLRLFRIHHNWTVDNISKIMNVDSNIVRQIESNNKNIEGNLIKNIFTFIDEFNNTNIF